MSQDQGEVLTDKEKLAQLRRELNDFIIKVDSAFLRDENGLPDYSGHKTTHRDQVNRSRELKAAKASIMKNIVSWALIGALTVIGSTLAQTYLVPTLVK